MRDGDWSAGPDGPTGRRVVEGLATMARALDELADAPLPVLGPRQHAEVLVELTRLEARLAELKLREAAAADAADTGALDGSPSTAAWWSVTTRQTRGAARAQVELGRRLAGDRAATRAALAGGHIVVAQAEVIVAAVQALPEEVPAEVVAQAEAHLLAEAAHHDAAALRVLGKRVLDVIAPELGEEQERKRLEEEERRARQRARLTMSDDGHGQTHGRFTLPTAQAAMFRKQLRAFAAPRHRAATGQPGVDPVTGERLDGPHRLGLAFWEWIERRQSGKGSEPRAGGLAATAVVTMTKEQLTGESDAPATLDTGERVTAAQARRLACEAGIIPVVLGGRSQPLDVGRALRFHTTAQRVAIGLRDGGCTADGCDKPPAECHVHHDQPWSEGGKTDVASGRLLCEHHHHRAHDPRYDMRVRSRDNKVTFHRRT